MKNSFLKFRSPQLRTGLSARTYLQFGAIVITTFFIICCGNTVNYNDLKDAFAETENSSDTAICPDSIFSLIPEYDSFIKPLSVSGRSFNKDVVVGISTQNEELGIKQTCFLLGVYIADIGYVRHYEQVQLCMDYLEEMKSCAARLSIPEELFNDVIVRSEATLTSKEQLFAIADSVVKNTSDYLEENELYGISVIIAAGLWLETYRIGIQLPLQRNDELMVNHMILLDQLIRATGLVRNDQFIQKLNTSLVQVQDAYNSNMPPEKLLEGIYESLGISVH